jgi:hypothetical protein
MVVAFAPYYHASPAARSVTSEIIRRLPMDYSQSFWIAQQSTVVEPVLPSGSTFEPVIPEMSTLAGFGSIVVLCILACYVWANQVVPVSRTNLAISKKNGEVRMYLDELRDGASNTTEANDGREFERWMFTDWLEKPAGKGGRQKEPAIPILKDAKWNSGDNPVLAASALIGAGVIFTALTERVVSLIP